MQVRTIILAGLVVVVGVYGLPSAVAADTASAPAPPDAMTIVEKMKAVFEPEVPQVAQFTVTFHPQNEKDVRWVGRQARKMTPEGKRTLVVMLEPVDIKGSAFLVGEQKGQPDVMWMYMPPIDRIRKLVPVEAYQSFLSSDFTYADLGFVSRQGQYRLLGEEKHNDRHAYKIEFAPQAQWYYSRIVTWVDTERFVPLQRDYYDVAGRLWKTQIFDQVTRINDKPTPLRIEMRDLQQGTSTIFTLSDIQYNDNIPDTLFDPTHLRVAAAMPPFSVATDNRIESQSKPSKQQ
jgi:outer membrane lipoprotein-sorting protein